MIKKMAVIKSFTDEQRCQLEAIGEAQKLKTAKAILLHCLENYYSIQQDNARLNRFLEMKQKKINRLQGIEE